MNHDPKDRLVLLTLIVGRNQKEPILAALLEAGMHLVNIVYGRGIVTANYLLSAFGLAPEERKAIITCVSTDEKVSAALRMLVERFHFDQPNTGIAYASHIDRVSH